PVGYCDFDGFEGEFDGEGQYAKFWSISNSGNKQQTILNYQNYSLDVVGSSEYFGLSVRFIKD
ncbi:MAG: hypothetical protein ACON5K_11200, partial [Bacteroidia bacterium]